MTNLTLKQLRYVEALAQHGHFGQAAAACAISQPALSMQIKELEAGLGVALFERGPGAVRLTRFGEGFVARAGAILRAVDDLGDLARAASAAPEGPLRLGVIPTVAPYLLPRLIPALAAAHPSLRPVIRETVTPRLIEELTGGRIDTALVALPVGEAALAEHPILTEAFVLVRPRAMAGTPVPPPERLGDERLLLLEEGHCFRDQALAFCQAGGTTPARDTLDGSSLATLVQMVGAGLGITLIPEMAVPVETRSADVEICRFPSPAPERRIGMVWRRTTPLAPQLAEIAATVRRAADKPGTTGPRLRTLGD